MATRLQATAYDNSLLSVLPPDGSNWMVLELAAQPESEPTKIVKVKVRVPNGQFKRLELVCQVKNKMRIYVNPDPLGCDEWEMPAESGLIFLVRSPGNDPNEG